MRPLALLAFGLLLVLPHSGATQGIALTDDLSGASCYLPIVTGPGFGIAYIVARLGTLQGITGAEFRVTGLPPEVQALANPNPGANLVIGDPLGEGCYIAFPSCQTGSNELVLLYTVTLLVTTPTTPIYILEVQAHSNPSNPAFACPLVVLCDAPVYTMQCVRPMAFGTGPILPQPSSPVPADGSLDVPVTTRLSWAVTGPFICCGIGTGFTELYFGTTNPPPFRKGDPANPFDPGPLQPHVTYYWRIRTTPDFDCGVATGSVWQFTTGETVGVDATTWDAVKSMFR